MTIVQARHAARSIGMTAPFLIAWWYLVRNAGHDQDRQLPQAAQLMAVYLAGVAVAVALLAAAALAATTGTLARWLPRMVGTTASVSMAIASLALAIASVLATRWPLMALAGSFAASHGLMAGSVRACRRCARLPVI
ncbi:hypothetical protein [Streptomyces sp. BE133]|uniref:hypothetical protein n=1 Tax=Streptomyces sp. BE133 TaxID=3002523 RepID=UPI002E77B549|nr:hypothetical protein [Streptomyces sp. BE133]